MSQQTVSFTVECDATLQARMVRSDYGVPGSPVWYEPEDVMWADYTVDILGVTVRLDALPMELRDVLLELAEEALDDGWEEEERDYG